MQHPGFLKRYIARKEAAVGKVVGAQRLLQGKRKDGSLFPISLVLSEVKLNVGASARKFSAFIYNETG